MAGPEQRMRGALSVVRSAVLGAEGAFETFITVTAEGSVNAYNGHVDLGTGIRTALGQIVAEELDVSFARVVVILGDTAVVPNQGATIASETIQITAVPLRKAAAQARHFLLSRAAERLELPVDDLTIEDGLIRGHDNRSVSYGELIADETIRLELADDVQVKAVSAYSVVGKSVPRVDLPAKATGELVYVHDVRVPGMLHGRVALALGQCLARRLGFARSLLGAGRIGADTAHHKTHRGAPRPGQRTAATVSGAFRHRRVIAFGDQQIAIGQSVDPARVVEVLGERGYLGTGSGDGFGALRPADRRGDVHRRDQGLVRFGQFR